MDSPQYCSVAEEMGGSDSHSRPNKEKKVPTQM
jgi:hypothetical protein